MKFNLLISLFISLILISHNSIAQSVTPRPIFATSIYNGSGFLYIPMVTPLANRACYFDNNSAPASSIVTSAELAYLSGVTSPIQSQINAITHGSRTTNTVSSNFIVPTLTIDYILNVNSSFAPVLITLPDAVASTGFCIDSKNLGVNPVTVAAPGGQSIDGVASISLSQYDSNHICSVNNNWFIY